MGALARILRPQITPAYRHHQAPIQSSRRKLKCPRKRGHFSIELHLGGARMSPIQLAINVTNLDKAIGFYFRLFDTSPAKVKPGSLTSRIPTPR